jgi:signal transduction histidine kinase
MSDMLPLQFPLFDLKTSSLIDGYAVDACRFCKESVTKKPECKEHYQSLVKKRDGYYQCPFGFTTRTFYFDGQMRVITGVIAFPRFDTDNERRMGKQFPKIKVSREGIDATVRFFRVIEKYRADEIQKAAKVLPQAFHELRKLNGAVLQHAEREIEERGESRSLLSIKSAAELMRNNFDILEALSNIEGMRVLPSDATINVFDLVFKMKRVLQEKAGDRGIHIIVNGVRAIIRGSQKSFPIVPAVLLENAIKYGRAGQAIRADIAAKSNQAVLTVENESDTFIDTDRCFERGARFSDTVEGGGFGLFLAKEIVQCHKGTIRCESMDGVVRMIVELPLLEVIA